MAKPYHLPYSGIGLIDRQLCALVVTFESLMTTQNFPFNVDLLSALTPMAAILAVETARNGSHWFLATQLIFSMLYQVSRALSLLEFADVCPYSVSLLLSLFLGI